MLIARSGEDRRMLAIAAAVEQHLQPTLQGERSKT
jgi:hypothetical protein